MTVRVFRGDVEVASIDPANRGLAYGDGLFETMRVHRGGVPLWTRHLARLQQGAVRLAIALPDIARLEARIHDVCGPLETGVLKLLVTRGEGGRGYAPAQRAEPTWLLSTHLAPPLDGAALRLTWCGTRLAAQPLLAGIKHCNRLEQVLARAEVKAGGFDEGLMCDTAGDAVCATSANLLVLRDGRWRTPPVESCGVAGVLRGWLLERGLVELAALSPDDVETADAVVLCNAVRGILPAASLGARAWMSRTAADALQASLTQAFPAFAREQE